MASQWTLFDTIRKGVFDNRSQFYKDLTMPFYDYNRPGAKVSGGVRESCLAAGDDGRHQGPVRLHQAIL